jgi:D-3-phosphoglycerate dehydrogenase / 2-oxoglutarate reductase
VDFDTLLREADVLSIHIHLQGNEGLIGRDAFAKMKPGAVLVNTSRGGIIEERAFIEALERGPLAGAGVDVITGEWDADMSKHPLIRYANTHDNLVISPHIGGVTFESQRMTLEHTSRKLRDFLKALA